MNLLLWTITRLPRCSYVINIHYPVAISTQRNDSDWQSGAWHYVEREHGDDICTETFVPLPYIYYVINFA